MAYFAKFEKSLQYQTIVLTQSFSKLLLKINKRQLRLKLPLSKNSGLKAIFLILAVLMLCNSQIQAQGCSDAGFCTVHGLNADNQQTLLMNNVRVGVNNGKGDNDIKIWSTYFEYSRLLSKSFSLGAKITYISESTPSLSNSGASDIFLSGNYVMENNLNIVAGVKIPLNSADTKFDSLNVGLPMGFQTSLGTFDLILGFGYKINDFKIDFGYQQPLSQNSNTYLSTSFPPGAPFGQYLSTNKFERKPDILLRAAYDFRPSKNWIITPGILPIMHLGNDQFTDSSGAVQTIDGSEGLTFNASLIVEYVINRNNSIVFGAAGPLVTRDSRPDGLGRKYLLNLDYKIAF